MNFAPEARKVDLGAAGWTDALTAAPARFGWTCRRTGSGC